MTRGIASPDDEVDRVLEVVADPLKSSVDQGNRRVAVGLFCAKDAGVALAPMAGIIAVGRRGSTVESIWVKVCKASMRAGPNGIDCLIGVPVMCRNLPCNFLSLGLEETTAGCSGFCWGAPGTP